MAKTISVFYGSPYSMPHSAQTPHVATDTCSDPETASRLRDGKDRHTGSHIISQLRFAMSETLYIQHSFISSGKMAALLAQNIFS